MVAQNDMHKLFAEIVCLVENETLMQTMRDNLARVDELNDTSKIVEDLKAVLQKSKER